MNLLVYLIAPETLMQTRHRNRFECDMYCHEGGPTLPNHSRIRRKGVGWGSEVLREAEPSMTGRILVELGVSLGKCDWMRVGDRLLRGNRRVQEERQMGVRRVVRDTVLIPNRPAVRTDLRMLTQRSHHLLGEANHLDSLSATPPKFGIG